MKEMNIKLGQIVAVSFIISLITIFMDFIVVRNYDLVKYQNAIELGLMNMSAQFIYLFIILTVVSIVFRYINRRYSTLIFWKRLVFNFSFIGLLQMLTYIFAFSMVPKILFHRLLAFFSFEHSIIVFENADILIILATSLLGAYIAEKVKITDKQKIMALFSVFVFGRLLLDLYYIWGLPIF